MCPDCSPPSRLPGPADLEVLHRDGHAGAHLGVLRDRREPVVRGLGQRPLGRIGEVGVAALAAAPDPAAQLVQLREAEHVGAVDDQRVRVRDVQARLDDRRRDEDVVLLLPEAEHDLLERGLAHLPVRDGDARLGHDLGELGGRPVDRLDPVVDVEHLPVAQQLAPDRRADLPRVVRADEGQDRVPLLRRGQDRRHLADAGQRHLERARDRRRRHRQHVDGGAQRPSGTPCARRRSAAPRRRSPGRGP